MIIPWYKLVGYIQNWRKSERLALWGWKPTFSTLLFPAFLMSNQQQNAEGLIRIICPSGFLLYFNFFVRAYFYVKKKKSYVET